MKKVVGAVVSLVVIVGLVVGSYFVGTSKPLSLEDAVAVEVETNNTQIIDAVTREEQVVLTSLAVQGIMERSANSQVYGVDVFGSGRTVFLQYTFSAKLGIDGAEVTIEEVADNEYVITIPEFIFIGHDDIEFQIMTEKNGGLSWFTPEIDTVEMVNDILQDDAQDQYIDDNRSLLQDQTRHFYSSIINGIDPTAVITFEFAGDTVTQD